MVWATSICYNITAHRTSRCSLILQQITLLRSDRDVIPIVQSVTTALRHVTEDSSFLNDDDEEDVSEEDDETIKEYADEETDDGNDVVDTEEDDDNHSYRTSDLD